MGRPPDGGDPKTRDLDAGLRETTANSLARWWRRVDSGLANKVENELVAREAAELSAVARSRGASELALRLHRVSVSALSAPAALIQSLHDVAEGAGLARRATHPPGRLPFEGTYVPGGGPPVQLPPPAAHPSQPPFGADANAPPSMLFSPPPPLNQRAERDAAPGGLPSPLGRSPVRAESIGLPHQATVMSQGVNPPEPKVVVLAPSAARSPPGAVRDAPPRARHDIPPAVPAPAAPPKLLEGTFLGFRAFGKPRARAAKPESPSAAVPAGLLGLGRRGEQPPLWRPEPPRRSSPFTGRRAADRPSGDFGRRARPIGPPAQGGFAVPRWFYGVAAAIGVLAVAVASVIGLSARSSQRAPPEPTAHTPAPTASTADPERAPLPVNLPKSAAETPQMRALLDAQTRLVQACVSDSAACVPGWTAVGRSVLARPTEVPVFTPAPDGPLPAWLHNLKMPSDFPVHDEPSLRNPFDFGTKNINGRANFQSMLSRCSAYSDIFESTLLKYGAPHWLTAVVYQESGCNTSATSPVGAKGLWQFMAESARAYGLRVVDGEVDERLNPVKSTEAAIHFLTDLQRDLGAWDLALAGYNMGPYAVLVRLAQAGDKNAGFWELAHAGMLPDETAGYVPSIEAYALMLQNLRVFGFNPYGKRLESTAEIIVKPGIRLSLIARASSTTTVSIRDLNPEFLRDVVPDGETTARVPDAEAHRAQAFLESWSPNDNRDTCVPPDFDWGGGQSFETSRFAKACAPVTGSQ
jgi:hypothetical protein